MINGHGGNIYVLARRLGCDTSEIIDMSSNLNPYGPPAGLVDHLRAQILSINALPEVDARTTVNTFADRYGIDPDRVLAGNGTTQFIYSIPQVLQSKRVLIIGPTYADYADGCRMHGISFDFHLALEENGFQPDPSLITGQLTGIDTVFICNPNNPTGVLWKKKDLYDIIRDHARVRFVVDESYLPFVQDGEHESLIDSDLPNLLLLHSLSKIFRIPGLRIGFLIAPEKKIKDFHPHLLPWNVNSLSQQAVQYLMSNRTETDAFVAQTCRQLQTEKEALMEALSVSCYLSVYPSATSFVLARLNQGVTAEAVVEYLSRKKLMIRNCSNFMGLSDRFIRISLKTADANRMAVQLLLELFEQKERAGNQS